MNTGISNELQLATGNGPMTSARPLTILIACPFVINASISDKKRLLILYMYYQFDSCNTEQAVSISEEENFLLEGSQDLLEL